ncbi:hypothetical protein AMTR_s00074p00185110 [Amborella trichopoda]|uniref:Uncharacterized protein n=2 Tax=Amborella trichopoda TaxID=13333 RepID=W1NM87_AMBTC|nr:hypothetical protein AMTR_s00074p00185110 [Amborella trichopoda]
MLDLPLLDVVGFPAVPQSPSGFKASMGLVSERDSLSIEVASLSEELKVVKAEMEELQARVDSLSTRRDYSWEALHQQSYELEQLDSDYVAVTSLGNSTAQEIFLPSRREAGPVATCGGAKSDD